MTKTWLNIFCFCKFDLRHKDSLYKFSFLSQSSDWWEEPAITNLSLKYMSFYMKISIDANFRLKIYLKWIFFHSHKRVSHRLQNIYEGYIQNNTFLLTWLTSKASIPSTMNFDFFGSLRYFASFAPKFLASSIRNSASTNFSPLVSQSSIQSAYRRSISFSGYVWWTFILFIKIQKVGHVKLSFFGLFKMLMNYQRNYVLLDDLFIIVRSLLTEFIKKYQGNVENRDVAYIM